MHEAAAKQHTAAYAALAATLESERAMSVGTAPSTPGDAEAPAARQVDAEESN